MNIKNIVLLFVALPIVNAFQPVHTVSKQHTKLKSTNDLYTSYYTPSSTEEVYNPPKEDVISAEPVPIQGGSLKTWSYTSHSTENVQIVLSSDGRPFDADIELWNGPNNTPCKMRVYVENGKLQPFTTILQTPRSPNTVAIRNIGQLELPFTAQVDNTVELSKDYDSFLKTIQGGAIQTFQFNPFVNSVSVFIKSSGYPINSRIELLQGPNNNKQVIELYSEDGLTRPINCILKTPDIGNVVRIINTAPLEFPMIASVVPHSMQLQ